MQKATLTDKDQAERVSSLENAIKALKGKRGVKDAVFVLECEVIRAKAGFDQNAMSERDVGDILTSAFEGGMSSFWIAGRVKVLGKWPDMPEDCRYASYVPAFGGKVEIVDGYSDEKTKYVITGENMRKGIILRAAQRGMAVQEWIEAHDAVEADCALQLAVMDDVVYG